MNDITLSLSVTEVDQCLSALAERPFKEVHQLMQKILEQGRAQNQPPRLEKIEVEDV